MSGEDGGDRKRPKGVRISACMGFVLVFLAVAVAVGVGLVVHFVEKIPGAEPAECSPMKEPTTVVDKTKPEVKKTENDVLLPQTITPLHYSVELKPNMHGDDPSTFNFTGYVEITMKCLLATNDVIMHAKKLDILAGSVVLRANDISSGDPKYLSHELDTDSEQLTVRLDKNMVADQVYSIKMNFSGPLEEGDLHGIYLSSYQRGNETVYLAATQFESRFARKAFPCFDEPKLKARFDVTLVRKKEMSTISNMKIDHVEEREPGFVADVYQTTPIMSTYLLAFIVSDFQYINGTTDHGLEYRLWGQKEFTDWLHYGLNVGMRTISHYEDYLNISFPLPKQDMVALPDFAPGAMENWGCITFRAERLFYNKETTSSTSEQTILMDITHELAHQWFGDLVTMEWWDDVWLNEGFATFFGFLGADFIEPEWKLYNIFVTDQIIPAFEDDAHVTSHPIVPVAAAAPYFDSISYNKGASVLRMLKFFVGDDTFRLGLIRYLKSHEYGNANHNDLWNSLHEQAQEGKKTVDVVDTMRTWTLQMNYPVVTVSRVGDRQLKLTQSRFLLDNIENDPGTFKSPYNYRWNIPFTFTTSDKLNFNVTDTDIIWISHKKDAELYTTSDTLPDPHDGSSWILGNVRHHGFYRVNYDKENWKNIIKQLKEDHEAILPINRAQVINDANDLARAGFLDDRLALGTLEYLSSERSYYPWKVTVGKIEHIDSMLRYTDIYGAFKNFIKNITSNAYKYYGTRHPSPSHVNVYVYFQCSSKDGQAIMAYVTYVNFLPSKHRLAQKEIATTACRYANPDCLQDSRDMFLAWKNNPTGNMVHPDLLLPVLCTGISEGVPDDWFFLYRRYKAETLVSAKLDMMEALACTREPWLMQLYLHKAITPGETRKNDALRPLYKGPALNPNLQAILWNFVRKNYNLLRDEFTAMYTDFEQMIIAATNTFNTNFDLQELEAFINSTSNIGVGEKGFKEALRQTKANINWMKKTYPVVKEWLKDLGFLE